MGAFMHTQPFEKCQDRKYVPPPAKISKTDAIHHGNIWMLKHTSETLNEKSKKTKKTKNGTETYGVLTKDHLLFYKNEKSAFDGGKFIESFAHFGSIIQWDPTSKSTRFELTIVANKLQLYHPKEESAKKWYEAIENLLKTQMVPVDVSSFHRVGSYKRNLFDCFSADYPQLNVCFNSTTLHR